MSDGLMAIKGLFDAGWSFFRLPVPGFELTWGSLYFGLALGCLGVSVFKRLVGSGDND